MQNQHLKLKEIIWEITAKCNNGCNYCGSKEISICDIKEKDIIKIAENIALFPPEEIDISGGDPLLISYETHEKVIKILKTKNVKCKILVNPKSLCRKEDISHTNDKILSLYDWIGLSINTEDELELVTSILVPSLAPAWFPVNKSTVISNFNLQNIFLYKEIENFVINHNLTWQIQYTIFKDQINPLAIYNSESALKFFSNLVSESINKNINVVIADNANSGYCSAGSNSIGILYNGDIVPCLSMRSWVENINYVVVGNIIKEDWKEGSIAFNIYNENHLKYIWENRFNKYRFECFNCCKDHCKNKLITITKLQTTETYTYSACWYPCDPISPRTMMYAVIKYPQHSQPIYPQPIVTVYAVFTKEYNDDFNITSKTYTSKE